MRLKTIVPLVTSFVFFGFVAFYFYDGGADAFLQRADKCLQANSARCLLEAAFFNFQILVLAAALLVIVVQAFVLLRQLARGGIRGRDADTAGGDARNNCGDT